MNYCKFFFNSVLELIPVQATSVALPHIEQSQQSRLRLLYFSRPKAKPPKVEPFALFNNLNSSMAMKIE